MAEAGGEEEDPVYLGTVKRLGVKDPTKYIITCPEATEKYKYDVRMAVEEKPADVEVGDVIRFKVAEDWSGRPVTCWVERKDPKRKEGEGEPSPATPPDAEPELYIGSIRAQCATPANAYLVECPAVTQWYGVEVKMSEKVKPHGAAVGDSIYFTIAESAAGLPRVTWAGFFGAAAAKEPPKKRARTAPRTAEVRMGDPESAAAAWEELNGSELKGCTIAVKPVRGDDTGLQLRVSGLPSSVTRQEVKDHLAAVGVVASVKLDGGPVAKTKA